MPRSSSPPRAESPGSTRMTRAGSWWTPTSRTTGWRSSSRCSRPRRSSGRPSSGGSRRKRRSSARSRRIEPRVALAFAVESKSSRAEVRAQPPVGRLKKWDQGNGPGPGTQRVEVVDRHVAAPGVVVADRAERVDDVGHGPQRPVAGLALRPDRAPAGAAVEIGVRARGARALVPPAVEPAVLEGIDRMARGTIAPARGVEGIAVVVGGEMGLDRDEAGDQAAALGGRRGPEAGGPAPGPSRHRAAGPMPRPSRIDGTGRRGMRRTLHDRTQGTERHPPGEPAHRPDRPPGRSIPAPLPWERAGVRTPFPWLPELSPQPSPRGRGRKSHRIATVIRLRG